MNNTPSTNQEKTNTMKLSRRKCLTAGGALLAASALPALAHNEPGDDENDADVLYGHGMVWNRELPGVAGDLKLSFDLRVNLATGAGFGTANDPIHPDWNLHFAINSVQQENLRKGDKRYTMIGVVTRANKSSRS